MDRGAWQTTVQRVTQSLTKLKRLSTTHTPYLQVGSTTFLLLLLFYCILTGTAKTIQKAQEVPGKNLHFLSLPHKNVNLTMSLKCKHRRR